jgi:hypothetical protein
MRLACAAIVFAGCGGAEPAPRRPDSACQGDWVITSQDDVEEVAACGAVGGDVTIRGAADLDLAALTPLASVAGDLVIGPTFDLDVVAVEGLREVGGALRIVSNGLATGVFLPRLERAGSVEVAGNVAIAGLSMPALREIGGDLIVEDNPGLEHLDAGTLTAVGGTLRIERNPALATVEVPDALRDRSPRW